MVEIVVRCNPGLEDGHAYPMAFTLDYVDSRGVHPSSVQSVQEVSVKVERGHGPALEFRTVSPETIKAGKDFTLSLAVFNTGDGTARNVVLGLGPQEAQGEGSDPSAGECPLLPTTLPVYLGDIEPDKFAMVEVPMRCNEDIMEGHVYGLCFCLDYTDDGGAHPPSTEMVHQVSIKTRGTPVTAEGTVYATGNTLLSVVTICLVIIVAIYAVGTVFRIHQNREPGQAREDGGTPRPPTETENQQYYADHDTDYGEAQQQEPQAGDQETAYDPQATAYDPQATAYDPQATAYDPQATTEQAPAEQYPQEGTRSGADTGSYYENQLWGGDQGGEGEDTGTQRPPPQ